MQQRKAEKLHTPVLLDATLQLLDPKRDEVFFDATLGLGGHAEAILRVDGVRLIAIDQDREAIELASERLQEFADHVQIHHANFYDLKNVLAKVAVEKVDGVLADLGVSSLQFDSESRGFSFRFDAPLDMRMDPESGGQSAADLLEALSEKEIADLIYKLGEERHSRRIAKRIVERRESGAPIGTTRELAELIERTVRKSAKEKIHPATRTFQALRIAVNREIEILEKFLMDAIDILNPEGRLAVITFHSLEDRTVKQTFQRLSGKCFCPPRIPKCICGAAKRVEILTKKPIVPSLQEISENPRSRSAKLRACRKL